MAHLTLIDVYQGLEPHVRVARSSTCASARKCVPT